jgi:predicted DNA-binding WGR domain protein
MAKQFFHVHIRRIDRTKNMARYYALSIQYTLFGTISLTRAWGRIGTRGQQRVHIFDDEKQAVTLFLTLLRKKRRRGYCPCSTDPSPLTFH